MSEHASDGATEDRGLGGDRPLPRTKGGVRRALVAGVGTLAVIGGVVGAVSAWQAVRGGGAQPAEALPASTLGYVAVDFDPSGGQKLAAVDFLRRFPSLDKRAGLSGGGDLRRYVFDELKSDLDCDLTFDEVEPWVGNRFAFAVVDRGGPVPVMVLQVADQDKATAGLERLSDCAGGIGYAFDGNWVVLAESRKIAGGVVSEATRSPLAEDAEFQHWTEEAGEPGVVTLYAAPEAGAALVSAAEDQPYGAMFLSSLPVVDPLSTLMSMAGFGTLGVAGLGNEELMTGAVEGAAPAGPGVDPRAHEPTMPPPLTRAEIKKLNTMTPAEQEEFLRKRFGEAVGEPTPLPGAVPGEAGPDAGPAIPADLRAALMGFSGLGGVVRFHDGAVELELVSDRIEGTTGNLVAGTAGDDLLAELPADTAAVFGAGLRDGWGAAFLERLAESGMPFGNRPQGDAAAQFEKDTGLTVADLEALGGNSFALMAGGDFSPEGLLEDPARMQVAARISGDAQSVEAALVKVRARMSKPDRRLLHWQRVGDDVLVSGNTGYLDDLATASGLTNAASFQDAVPNASEAASVFYLNLDSGDWLTKTVDESDRRDIQPLAALGYSLHDEGRQERTLLRLTTED